jgi:hypothetical protein
MRLKSRFVLGMSFAALLGSAAYAAASDPWVTGAPANPHWSDDSVVITPDRWIDVPAESQDKALAMLANRAVVPLEPGLFLDLLPGRGYPADPGKKPYLVRGVALNEETGGFQIEQRGPELLVVFAAARNDTPPKHRALIVMLPSPASREFVQTVTVE